MKIDLILNVNLPRVPLHSDPDRALMLMKENHVRSLPVIAKDRYEGMVSDERLLEHMKSAGGNSRPESLASLIDRGSVHLTLDAHVGEAIRLFSETSHDVLPVLGSNQTLLGCVLEKELMDFAGELLSVYEKGSTVEVRFNGHDFSLTEVVRLIEENQARIMSLNSLPGAPGADRHHIEIKVNVLDGSRIRAALARAGYSVRLLGEEEDLEDKDFRDRIEELMKFIEP